VRVDAFVEPCPRGCLLHGVPYAFGCHGKIAVGMSDRGEDLRFILHLFIGWMAPWQRVRREGHGDLLIRFRESSMPQTQPKGGQPHLDSGKRVVRVSRLGGESGGTKVPVVPEFELKNAACDLFDEMALLGPKGDRAVKQGNQIADSLATCPLERFHHSRRRSR
jgi:hypothetical protein